MCPPLESTHKVTRDSLTLRLKRRTVIDRQDRFETGIFGCCFCGQNSNFLLASLTCQIGMFQIFLKISVYRNLVAVEVAWARYCLTNVNASRLLRLPALGDGSQDRQDQN
jgi:hypothetical protein